MPFSAHSTVANCRRIPPPSSTSSKCPSVSFLQRNSSTQMPLIFRLTMAMMVLLSVLLVAQEAQAAALSIPVSEMLKETEEPFERDDRDYRPLQFGKRDNFRPLQFGKKSVYRPLQFGKRGGAHYWPVESPPDSRLVEIVQMTRR